MVCSAPASKTEAPERSRGVTRAALERYTLADEDRHRLSPSQADRLRERAKNLGLQPEDLARAAVADLLSGPDDEFRAAAELVLQKNADLYKRLA
jgi:hypothetical protein